MPVPAPSQLSICNQACARLPCEPIVTTDENSLPARECRRFYPLVIANMLEGPHNWSFANQRVSLSLAGTNGRDQEWLYAYSVPSGMAAPIRLVADLQSLGIGVPIPIPGEPYAEMWQIMQNGYEIPYIIESGILYTNAQDAILEYTISDIEGVAIPNKVANALSLELASYLAVPVKKDSAREKELLALADLAWDRAIAEDRNRQPETYGDYVSEAMIARHGGC